MFSKFNEEARKVLINAKKEMILLKHPFVGSEHILLSILSNNNLKITKFLKTINLDYNSFRKEILLIIGEGSEENNLFLYTPMLKRIIEEAIITAKDKDEDVSVSSLFIAMLEEGEGVAIRIMLKMGIDLNLLYDEFYKDMSYQNKSNKKLLLMDFGCDLVNKALNNELDPVIGREEELNRLIQILSRKTKNNPLLIGEAGVGKTAIVEELAKRIASNEVPVNLMGKKIISIASSSLVAGTKYRGEFEERINKIIKEAETNAEIILFIDEIHTIIGAGGAEGAIDASNILKPSLARGKIKLIGATTTSEYKQYIEKDKAFDRRLQPIYIEETTNDCVLNILKELKPIYETFHNVTIKEEILQIIVDLSNKYMHNRKQPDKAIDVLDEVCVMASLIKDEKIVKVERLKDMLNVLSIQKEEYIKTGNYDKSIEIRKKERKIETQINNINLQKVTNRKKDITLDMIYKVINYKTKIPIHLFNKDTLSLDKEFNELKNKIINQDNIIDELSLISKRILLGLKTKDKPFSILFCGGSGVGKTQLAKEFANIYGGTNALIRLDMSEFKESHTISKIIGSPAGYVGYADNKNILEEVKNKPFCILLLDEIEKANINVINLFLQILDEGKIKDSKGDIIYFDNTIIIMTSNIGFSKEKLGFTNELTIHSKLKEFFSIEFLNRIDKTFTFNKLDSVSINKIIDLKISEIINRLKLNNVKVNYKDFNKKEILNKCNYEEFGARRIEKLIEEQVDNLVINSFKSNKTKVNL